MNGSYTNWRYTNNYGLVLSIDVGLEQYGQ